MKVFKVLMVFCALVLFAVPAYANLIITPSMADYSGNETSDAAIQAAISGIISPAVLLYKDNVSGIEEGPLTGSYETVYDTEPEASDATITYTGGDVVGPVAWLLVKDGKQIPAWYLFNLTDLPIPANWDGMETLELLDFWPDNGAISHVALYGTREGTQVPEPSTMLLLGVGLVGLAGFGRKLFKK